MFEINHLKSKGVKSEIIQLLETLPLGAILINKTPDNEYVVEYCSKQAKKYLPCVGNNLTTKYFQILLNFNESVLDDKAFEQNKIIETSLNVEKEIFYFEAKLGFVVCNNVKYYIAYLNDITKTWKYRQRAEKAEQELKVILENTRFGIKQMTPDLDIINANKTACVAMNSELDHLIGSKCYTHVGNTEPCKNCPVLLSIETKSPQEHIQEPGNGNSYLINSVPVLNDQNQVTSIIEFFEDITDAMEKESNLIESENKFKNLFEYSNDPIFILDNGIIADCNITSFKTFGFRDKEKLIGNEFNQLIPSPKDHLPQDFFCFKNKYHKTQLDKELKKNNNSTFHGSISASWIKIKGKNLQQIIISDITLRKQIERELVIAKNNAEQASQLKTSFLANMSHEIRTPLNAILGFSELLISNQIETSKHNQFLELIYNSGDQLLHLVNDILDLSKIEAGQVEIKKEPVHLNYILDELFDMFKVQLANKQLRFKLTKELDDSKCTTILNNGKLKQIITNLLSNSIKFTDSGYIHTGYKIEGDYLKFFVEDTGIGINEDAQKVVFDRFIQTGNASQQSKGTGLGLAICKGLVELMGGRMWLTSELGKGTTFYFTVPFEPCKI